MKVLVINPGATSTKIAAFNEEAEIFRSTIEHKAEALEAFRSVSDQMPLRKMLIAQTLAEKNVYITDFDAVCGRGGLLRPIPSGTYRVNHSVIQDVINPKFGEHAANLGPYLAKEFADEANIPAFFVDPVCVDELSPVARISGLKGVERQSLFHALNHKAVSRLAAVRLNKPYEEVNLVVAQLGGGVSVAAHEQGRVIDVNNVRDEGSMSLDRGGSIPIQAVIDICFSGTPRDEVKRLFASEAGVFSYVGTKDFREVERRAFEQNDGTSLCIFEALVYQLAKDIGSMAAVLKYRVDAIVLTGGMAFSDRLCSMLAIYIDKIAPVLRFPGEEEMRSLAQGALRVLHGETCLEYVGGNEPAC